ncbi:MAG: VWA domain-containing protein [Opitutae bacterium]|nr:VWA domain-containing protein [Opitutae bacterium]
MNFAWPHLLWLVALPVALLAWESVRRRRQGDTDGATKILRGEAGAHYLSLAADPARRDRHRGPRIWLYIGLTLVAIALARPQWGRDEEQVFDQSREIILALDLSRSMQAPDVKPARLDRAKLLVQALLERLKGERVGLVVFSGTAFLQSPLSADYEILREFLPVLGTNFLPEGGTNYAALLRTSLEAFAATGSADRFLIVLSDGEATEDDWKPLADELKTKGVRVLALGVGTEAGAMIPDGAGGFVKDERGAVVLSKLESATLRQLADITGGAYRDASTWVDLAALLQQTVEQGRQGQFTEKRLPRYIDRFQWVLAPAVLCLLLSFWREFPVRPRPRDLTLAAKQSANAAAMLFLLAAGFWTLADVRAAESSADTFAAPLCTTVQRLSSQENTTAANWAELARETITWGQRTKSAQQPVLEGPIKDGLTAVSAGEALDPKIADWGQLRRDLEALLQKPEQQQKQDQQQNNQQKQDQKQDQNQDKQQQKQDQQNSDQNQQQQKQQQSEKSEPKDQKQNQSSSQQQQQQQDQKQQSQERQSAFGDMADDKKQQPPPPPQSNETQKVGGAEKKPATEKTDPALALPLQKLEQLKNQDSPARLFQLMEGEKKPNSAKKGKDW